MARQADARGHGEKVVQLLRCGLLLDIAYIHVSVKAFLKGVDRELRKSRDATHFATDGPAPRQTPMTGRIRDSPLVVRLTRLCPE